MKNRNRILLSTLATCTIAAGASQAAPVYLEDFEVTGTTMASAGWTAVQGNGTTLTNSFGLSSGLAGSSTSAFWSGGWAPVWTVSDAPTITDPLADVSWIAQKAATTYRLGIEVGGTWYLSGDLNAASDGATITVSNFSSGFAAWSDAPADDSTAWDDPNDPFPGTLGTPGALPSGTVTRVGLMGLDNLGSKIDNFTINTVPEPGSLALLGLGGLLVASRRRRG